MNKLILLAILTIANFASAQTVVGGGSAGGVTLISKNSRLVLNGNKVYDTNGNVQDVLHGNGVKDISTVKNNQKISAYKIGLNITMVFDGSQTDDIQVSGDSNIISRVNLKVENGVLHADILDGGYSFKTPVIVKFGGDVQKFRVSSSDFLVIKKYKAKTLDLDLGSSSRIVLFDSVIDVLNVNINSSASLAAHFNNEIKTLNIQASSSSVSSFQTVYTINGRISSSAKLMIAKVLAENNLATTSNASYIKLDDF